MGGIEFGKCEICGKECQLHRTYFYYPIHCECCGCKVDGESMHFELVCHCEDCPIPIPAVIHPRVRDMYGQVYEVDINMSPCRMSGTGDLDEGCNNHIKLL